MTNTASDLTIETLGDVAEVLADVQPKRLPDYPAYRASGVAWLGDIPKGWSIKRLRFVSRINPVKSELKHVGPDDAVSFVPMEALHEYGGMTLEQERLRGSVEQGYTYFRDGDIVVAKITPCFENGKGSIAAGLTNGVGFGTTELHVVRSFAELDRDFAFFLTMCDPFRKLGEGEMFGAGGQKRIPDSFIKDFRAPLPPLAEQKVIAAFLRRATAKIDALVEKKRRLIELLKEKRTALISHAVTKGLNPDAPMKPSGIDWLGDVPKHWEVRRLKYVASIKSGDNITSDSIDVDGDYPVYGGNGLRGYTSAYTHDGEYVLIGRQGALCGNVHRVRGQFWASEHCAVATCVEDVSVDWCAALIEAMGLKRHSETAAQPGLAVERILRLAVPCPPLAEQEAIAHKLSVTHEDIDRITDQVSDAISRLTEYRSALISAAVTGKIDVRGEVP